LKIGSAPAQIMPQMHGAQQRQVPPMMIAAALGQSGSLPSLFLSMQHKYTLPVIG
jgi:hypothetical protein